MQDVRELRDAQGQSDASRSAEACLAAQVTLLQDILARQRDTIEQLIDTTTDRPALSRTWLVVDEDGLLTGASDDACAILERTRDDLVGTRLDDAIKAGSAAVEDGLRRAFADGHAQLPGRLAGFDQGIVFTLQRVPDAPGGGGRVVVDAVPDDQSHWTATNAAQHPRL